MVFRDAANGKSCETGCAQSERQQRGCIIRQFRFAVEFAGDLGRDLLHLLRVHYVHLVTGAVSTGDGQLSMIEDIYQVPSQRGQGGHIPKQPLQ